MDILCKDRLMWTSFNKYIFFIISDIFRPGHCSLMFVSEELLQESGLGSEALETDESRVMTFQGIDLFLLGDYFL